MSMNYLLNKFQFLKAFHLQLVVICFLVVQICFLFLAFQKWGSFFTSDTLNYMSLAMDMKSGSFPYSASYTPGYPVLLYIVHKFSSASLMSAASLLSFFIYVTGFFIVFKIVCELTESSNKISCFIASAFLVNSWFFLKIIFNAHADGLFFLFHLLVFLSLIKALRRRNWYLYLLSFLSIIHKANDVIFFPNTV